MVLFMKRKTSFLLNTLAVCMAFAVVDRVTIEVKSKQLACVAI